MLKLLKYALPIFILFLNYCEDKNVNTSINEIEITDNAILGTWIFEFSIVDTCDNNVEIDTANYRTTYKIYPDSFALCRKEQITPLCQTMSLSTCDLPSHLTLKKYWTLEKDTLHQYIIKNTKKINTTSSTKDTVLSKSYKLKFLNQNILIFESQELLDTCVRKS